MNRKPTPPSASLYPNPSSPAPPNSSSAPPTNIPNRPQPATQQNVSTPGRPNPSYPSYNQSSLPQYRPSSSQGSGSFSSPAQTFNHSNSAPRPHSSGEPLPPDFELLLEAVAIVTERVETKASNSADFYAVPYLRPPQPPAPLIVLQGPMPDAWHQGQQLYYAFISTRSYNIPLLPSTSCRRLTPYVFRVKAHNRRFLITLAAETEKEQILRLDTLLHWFCTFTNDDTSQPFLGPSASAPAAVAGAAVAGATVAGATAAAAASPDRFKRFADKGINYIDKIGERVDNKIQSRLTESHASASAARSKGGGKNVKMGGRVTSGALSTTQKVVSSAAKITTTAVEKISSVVGQGLVKNPVSKNFAKAPVGSKRRSFFDELSSGCLAVGRVFVAGDHKVKMIFEKAGDRAATVAGAKYGGEAEEASRKLATIALDGYKVFRFPHELGYKSILKGGMSDEFKKATAAQHKKDDGSETAQLESGEKKANRTNVNTTSHGPSSQGLEGASSPPFASSSSSSEGSVLYVPIVPNASIEIPRTNQ